MIVLFGITKVEQREPEKTNYTKTYKTVIFREIDIDSLNALLGSIIVEANLSSDHPFNVISNNHISTTKSTTMEWTTNTSISSLPNPLLEDIKLKELELKHEEKLYTLEKQYYDNLKHQQKEIAHKLEGQVSDYTRELLVTHLKEIDNEIIGYHLDNSKIQKLKAEIDLLKEKASMGQRFTGEVKVLRVV